MVTVTGASGKTGSVVAQALLASGEKVRVTGRSAQHLEALRQKGAFIAEGDQGDADFLTAALKGADALYLLIPPKFDTPDFRKHYNGLGNAAVKAISASGVKKVVFLSSLGADKPSGTGPVVGLYDVEGKLRTLGDVDIAVLRPGYFMENTLGNMGMIKEKGINGGPIAPDIPISLTATVDIGQKAAELLKSRSFKGHSIIELVGDRLSYAQITAHIGRVAGIEHLPYIQFSDSDAEAAFRSMGLSVSVAQSYIELMHGISKGLVGPLFIKPDTFNVPTRFADFADEVIRPAFAAEEHHAMV